jgi:hypothetical protein
MNGSKRLPNQTPTLGFLPSQMLAATAYMSRRVKSKKETGVELVDIKYVENLSARLVSREEWSIVTGFYRTVMYRRFHQPTVIPAAARSKAGSI